MNADRHFGGKRDAAAGHAGEHECDGERDGRPLMLAVVNVNGQEQLNVQIPWEAAGQSQVSVAINNGLATSAAVNVTLSAAQPGIFLLDGVNGAIEHVSGVVVSAAAPVAKGEAVVVFWTVLGPVSLPSRMAWQLRSARFRRRARNRR